MLPYIYPKISSVGGNHVIADTAECCADTCERLGRLWRFLVRFEPLAKVVSDFGVHLWAMS